MQYCPSYWWENWGILLDVIGLALLSNFIWIITKKKSESLSKAIAVDA